MGNNEGTVSDCYNYGTVSGSGTNVGAVAGYNGGTVEDCKWLKGTAEKGIGDGTDDGATSYDLADS